MYRCARESEWGDRLPLHYEQQQESLQEAEPVCEMATKNKKNVE